MPTDHAKEQVTTTIAALIEADNAGDVDAIASCYAADAVFLPPTGPSVHGREEIRKRYAEGLSRFELDVSLIERDTSVADNWAFSRGETAGRFVWRDGSPPKAFNDKYLMILKRDERGKWLIYTLMWNPVGTPTETNEAETKEIQE